MNLIKKNFESVKPNIDCVKRQVYDQIHNQIYLFRCQGCTQVSDQVYKQICNQVQGQVRLQIDENIKNEINTRRF